MTDRGSGPREVLPSDNSRPYSSGWSAALRPLSRRKSQFKTG
jgi:hypothetical protein